MKTLQNNEQKKQNEMSRGEFLRSLGLSGATLMALYCMGTMTSCSNSKDDPAPTNNNNNGGNTGGGGTTGVDFTIDLTQNLTKNGQFLISGDVIVARTSTGAFVALSKVCTHQGTTIEFQGNDTFKCNNHGSVFLTTGAVSNGPAADPLKVYKTELKENNTKLRVSE